ncbi:RHS element protein dsORF-h1, partial [Escherichia coli]
MMKYLMVLLSLFSGSVLGMGRVNELCGIDSVKTIEIINLPSYVTTLVPLSMEGLNEIYRYKVVVNEISDLYAGKIIDLLQMKYFRKEKYNNIRWGVSII